MMQPINLNDPPIVDAESQEMEMQERRQFMESPVSPTVPDSAFAPNSMSSFKRGREDLATEYANKGSIAPEQEIIILAFRLAILEKVASGLGTLAFVWATIVLLGGFAGYLDQYDFWVIWALLVTEGTRVFSKSHEVEWQHAAGSAALTVKVKEAGASILHRIKAAVMFHKPADTRELPISKNPGSLSNKEVKEDWSGSKVPVFPSNILSAQHISFLLHSLQLASSLATVALSLSRLIQQNYISMHSFHNANNLIYGLNLFYSLSLAEATVFLVEKAYWEYQINCRRALLNVTEKARLDDELLDMIQMFFYDVYSTCLKGSVLHGLDMDLIGFSIQKIISNDVKEQLGGALILSAFITQHEFGEHTIRKIDTTPGVIERLLEMLTWKNTSEKEIRRAAAYILSQVVRRRSNCYRITLSSGALEGIISILQNLCPNLSEADKAEIVAMAPFVLQITLDHENNEANNPFFIYLSAKHQASYSGADNSFDKEGFFLLRTVPTSSIGKASESSVRHSIGCGELHYILWHDWINLLSHSHGRSHRICTPLLTIWAGITICCNKRNLCLVDEYAHEFLLGGFGIS